MCGACGAELQQLFLTDLPRLLKHYSQNPSSPGGVGLPRGESLAYEWDAAIVTSAEFKQKIDRACVLGERTKKRWHTGGHSR